MSLALFMEGVGSLYGFFQDRLLLKVGLEDHYYSSNMSRTKKHHNDEDDQRPIERIYHIGPQS